MNYARLMIRNLFDKKVRAKGEYSVQKRKTDLKANERDGLLRRCHGYALCSNNCSFVFVFHFFFCFNVIFKQNNNAFPVVRSGKQEIVLLTEFY